MNFDHNHYVPCLRWKQGEYQAVLTLSTLAHKFITPLIEVPEMGFDFEMQALNRTIDEHLAPFAKRVSTKWGTQTCFVDILHIPPEKVMEDGSHPISFIFEKLRAARCSVVPVIGLGRGPLYQQKMKSVVSQDRRGLCMRVNVEEAANLGLKDQFDTLLANIGIGAVDCDLILDLGAPNFQPIDGFAKLVEALIRRLPYMERWRTFTLLGTSIPPTMGDVRKSPAIIPRSEWILYKKLIESLRKIKVRLPTFGDYGISHPAPVLMDMRFVKPSGTIRYTRDDDWLIVKGPNVRDNGYGQFKNHCQLIVGSTGYLGAEFSEGDKYISKCAVGAAGTGNLTTWRKVGTNHHLEKVARDISSLFGSSTAL